jgi:hypothetical protein
MSLLLSAKRDIRYTTVRLALEHMSSLTLRVRVLGDCEERQAVNPWRMSQGHATGPTSRKRSCAPRSTD